MNVTCPSCGADMDLDVLLAHEDSRRALARLAEISLPLGKLLLQYVRLFKPPKRQLGHSRVVRLIEEVLPDMERQAITRAGREWDAPRDAWRLALEQVLQRRDDGKLVLPLKTHGYLYEVLVGMAYKAEAQAEREREAMRRSRAHVGGLQPAAATVGETLQRTAVAPPPSYAGPSRAAQQIKAQIAAAQARKLQGDPEGGAA